MTSTEQATRRRRRVVLAPMVRGSEAAFRLLVKQESTNSSDYELCCLYSPMMRASAVVNAFQEWSASSNSAASSCDGVEDEKKKQQRLDSIVKVDEDEELFMHDYIQDEEKLVVQLCGCAPDVMADATRAVLSYYNGTNHRPRVHGIDFNLGCPQSTAKHDGFGAFLGKPSALACIRAMRQVLDEVCDGSVCLSAKIRLLETDAESIQHAQDLERAGCDVLAIHCRTLSQKSMGPPNLVGAQTVVRAVNMPVYINGASITCLDDVDSVLDLTGAYGVMMARPFLTNPRLLQSPEVKLDDPSMIADLACAYLDAASLYPPPNPLYIQKHLRWIFRNKVQSRDVKDWRYRLWTFLVRPYVVHMDQFYKVVALYVHQEGCNMPEAMRVAHGPPHPPPSFSEIRHAFHGKEKADEEPTEEYGGASLFG